MSIDTLSLRLSIEPGLCKRQREYLDNENSPEGVNCPILAVDYDSHTHPQDDKHISASNESTPPGRHQTFTYLTKEGGKSKKWKRLEDPPCSKSKIFYCEPLCSR